MQPLNSRGIKTVLSPCSYINGQRLRDGVEENTCFGITDGGPRCKARLSSSRQGKLTHSLDALYEVADDYKKADTVEDQISVANDFFKYLKRVVDLQHCNDHKDEPMETVASWQRQINRAHCKQKKSKEQSSHRDEDDENDENDEEEDDDEDDNDSIASSSPSDISFSAQGDTPRHTRTVTPNTTPQTGKFIRLTTSAKTTPSAKGDSARDPIMLDVDDDDEPSPPASPTPGERLKGHKEQTQNKQRNQQPPKPSRLFLQDKGQKPVVKPTVSADIDPFLVATEQHACYEDSGLSDDLDCYFGMNYAHVIETMQLGYAHYQNLATGRLYVIRNPGDNGVVKIGFSNEEKVKKRWQSTPCSQWAAKNNIVFVSEVRFQGARKVEALVKASLRHQKIDECNYCHKAHNEWFRVQENVILAWVHVWTAYVQSDVYDMEGVPTKAYREFANRLLRITPETIHRHIRAGPSSPPSEKHSNPTQEGQKDPPLQSKPALIRSATATSIRQFMRRVGTSDRSDKNEKGSRVSVQEVGDLDASDGEDDGHRRNIQQKKKAPQVASKVVSQIQSGVSGVVKLGVRLSKRA